LPGVQVKGKEMERKDTTHNPPFGKKKERDAHSLEEVQQGKANISGKGTKGGGGWMKGDWSSMDPLKTTCVWSQGKRRKDCTPQSKKVKKSEKGADLRRFAVATNRKHKGKRMDERHASESRRGNGAG